jgi:hypothetical protein
MRKIILKKISLVLILIAASPAFAKLDFEDHAFPEFVTSARALAMGNAYINKVDDSWSAFYNPAGLGTVRKPQFYLMNAHLEASSGLLDIVGQGSATEIPGNYLESYDVDRMRTELVKNQGELVHSRFNIFPNLTVRGLTLGYLFTQRNRAIINDDVANEFEVAERKDQGPVMSLNASLFGGVFKIGATAVYLSRKELYKAFGPSDPVSVTGNDYKSGSSLQLTTGARLTMPWALLPTLSLVLRNATNNDFEGVKNGGSPEEIKQTFDVGLSITPQIGKMSRLHFELNLKDLNNAYDTDYKRRAAAGMEIDFRRRIFLRAGWGDGWGSAGIGVRSRTFIMDITTYAVDRSLEGFREEEDRRWVLSLSSGL